MTSPKSPSPSGEGLGWGSARRQISARLPPPPAPPLKGRGGYGRRFPTPRTSSPTSAKPPASMPSS
ncbi:hypothetical protein E2E30_17120 [Sphingomonas sp. AAP5]|nr:hypothetical protein E2E30_17120 [Sphingomonas sp. AAP5]